MSIIIDKKNPSLGSAISEKIGTNRVLRNTYLLLSLTLIFSAITAYLAMAMNVRPMSPILTFVIYMGLVFGIRFTSKSMFGLVLTFVFTGFMGYTLGPILNFYLQTQAGTQIVTLSLATTAITFLALSSYVLITGKDMSFLGGILFAGVIVLLVGGLLMFVVSMLTGMDLSFLQLAFSVVSALISCGYILYTTSAIIHGGERNYILATVMLYVSIYNLFLSLLTILSVFSGRR